VTKTLLAIVFAVVFSCRYGSKPSDAPFLWNMMSDYACSMASLFDGIRVDNMHSTPIHVAQYLIDRARLVKPNLVVLAELFTGQWVSEWVSE